MKSAPKSNSLFAGIEAANAAAHRPLASRMRPRTLDEIVGQRHLLEGDSLLRRLIRGGTLGSVVLHGPPGTGKTTLARILAASVGGQFRALSAVSASIKDVREVLAWAADEIAAGRPRPVLFIDEIHRFNRSQQDALLHDVEEGVVDLISATTANPSFAINDALLSRSHVFALQTLAPEEIGRVVEAALRDDQRGLGSRSLTIEPAALGLLTRLADGDARRALGAIELAAATLPPGAKIIDEAAVRESMQSKTLRFDRAGDEHYDLASALIKSIRGSDVDASLYWLAAALESGEDIRFLCRRLVILASEDVGNADPQALPLAVAAMQACEFVGLPECQLTLSQCVIYLALAPKSNAATAAIGRARREVREGDTIPVPTYLRDAHSSAAKSSGVGAEYQYAHDFEGGVAAQEYLGVDKRFYEPSGRGFEAELSKRLSEVRRRLGRAGNE